VPKIKERVEEANCFPRVYLWYNRSGVESPNLPSASSTSLGFFKFAMIQDLVWMDL
jgi:hypothetical protein